MKITQEQYKRITDDAAARWRASGEPSKDPARFTIDATVEFIANELRSAIGEPSRNAIVAWLDLK